MAVLPLLFMADRRPSSATRWIFYLLAAGRSGGTSTPAEDPIGMPPKWPILGDDTLAPAVKCGVVEKNPKDLISFTYLFLGFST
jgi:hypothetical protein